MAERDDIAKEERMLQMKRQQREREEREREEALRALGHVHEPEVYEEDQEEDNE